MGEAKRRGNFVQRKAEAIVRNEADSINRAEAAEERLRVAEERAQSQIHSLRGGRMKLNKNRALISLAICAGLVNRGKL